MSPGDNVRSKQIVSSNEMKVSAISSATFVTKCIMELLDSSLMNYIVIIGNDYGMSSERQRET